ncbi:helix-turn-helix domain-containing protein [Ammoniphilus resinae]|uniref:XRE family transcriptional regulator of biofilm formation n=1 Tax=Ammoniphilus resinae TaxID=861532 RepID=A0ABS4GVR4_9BACL|nr:helix-turn-helix domain-containing protein [Ammoniphilus resinae]MBP1934117.1 XRE family transcriptional regulator of biofilm formation [Ammoniphilus resinae]
MIGHKIHLLRIKNGLSISELAKRADVSKSYLSTVERSNDSNPSVQFLGKIARALHISIDDLLQEDVLTYGVHALDSEWEELLNEIKESNMTKEQFRDFIEYKQWVKKNSL